MAEEVVSKRRRKSHFNVDAQKCNFQHSGRQIELFT